MSSKKAGKQRAPGPIDPTLEPKPTTSDCVVLTGLKHQHPYPAILESLRSFANSVFSMRTFEVPIVQGARQWSVMIIFDTPEHAEEFVERNSDYYLYVHGDRCYIMYTPWIEPHVSDEVRKYIEEFGVARGLIVWHEKQHPNAEADLRAYLHKRLLTNETCVRYNEIELAQDYPLSAYFAEFISPADAVTATLSLGTERTQLNLCFDYVRPDEDPLKAMDKIFTDWNNAPQSVRHVNPKPKATVDRTRVFNLAKTAEQTAKPGDWTCPRCSSLNFAHRSSCFKCSEVRPKDQPRYGAGSKGAEASERAQPSDLSALAGPQIIDLGSDEPSSEPAEPAGEEDEKMTSPEPEPVDRRTTLEKLLGLH